MPSQIGAPFYFFLAAASFGHGWAAVLLVLSAAVFWPLICYISLVDHAVAIACRSTACCRRTSRT